MFADIEVTQLYILRHGECEGGNIFRGSTDVALLEKGMANMNSACKQSNVVWDVIVSSPLIRCHEFAKAKSQELSRPLVVDERLREMFFGSWEGKLMEDVWREQYDSITAWMKNPEAADPPNGEPLAEVFERVEVCYQQLLAAHRGKKILLVTHGGIVRALLTFLLGMPRSKIQAFDVPYASLSQVSVYHMEHGDRVKLTAHNFTQ
ncbi:histidine phosphatase family protein [Agarilytica rhodophyticola]|uniref:histidine phosphatase family protein n=1 Tax=Agarilytica rhodophyticola TaxID=1737490 RepID=UPI000B341725|nr:histidine phosphatase family protein [Agarilytica rhodophyticola]